MEREGSGTRGDALGAGNSETGAESLSSDHAMDWASWKWQIGTAWVLTVALIGFALRPMSAAGWALCAAVAMTLPVIVARFWHEPEPSTSESIRDALR